MHPQGLAQVRMHNRRTSRQASNSEHRHLWRIFLLRSYGRVAQRQIDDATGEQIAEKLLAMYRDLRQTVAAVKARHVPAPENEP